AGKQSPFLRILLRSPTVGPAIVWRVLSPSGRVRYLGLAVALVASNRAFATPAGTSLVWTPLTSLWGNLQMRCSKCGAENPDRAKFCVECALPFLRRCPSCSAENPPNAKFCLECAKPLEAGATAAPTNTASARLARNGERRHLIALIPKTGAISPPNIKKPR